MDIMEFTRTMTISHDTINWSALTERDRLVIEIAKQTGVRHRP